MNKFLVTLIYLLISYDIFAKNYTENIEFIKIQKTVQNKPRVVEFFSFYCSHCYQFESIYHVSQTIAKNLPKKVKMERYHIDFFGALGTELTKAWMIAIVLKVEDKVSPLLFEGIQKTKSINTLTDIKDVFIKVGIKSKEYDSTLNSFIVKSLIIKQKKEIKDFKLHSVPTIFVNDKYMLCNNGISVDDLNDYAKNYSNIVNFLLNK
ncbi:MAG: DsbA family protein [Arsenophonus sp. ET-YP4-MAG3]